MKHNQWKTLSVPVMTDEFLRSKERAVARLKESGAQFVFVSPRRTFDPVKYQENLDTLPEIIRTLSEKVSKSAAGYKPSASAFRFRKEKRNGRILLKSQV